MRHFRDEGFTLVELMVVVAIIGALSVVAIPNFRKYQAKSKTSEAKIQLSSLYTAETTFYADYDMYATCLGHMGYNPTADLNRYYAMGFGVAGAVAVAANPNCVNGTLNAFAATKAVGGVAAAGDATWITQSVAPAAGTPAAQTFKAGATGVVDAAFNTAATADKWSINESKTVLQDLPGY